MKLLTQFPTYSRPKKFLDVLKQYIETCSEKNEIFFNINCDVDDLTMTDQQVDDAASREGLTLCFGNGECGFKGVYNARRRDKAYVQDTSAQSSHFRAFRYHKGKYSKTVLQRLEWLPWSMFVWYVHVSQRCEVVTRVSGTVGVLVKKVP